MCDIENIAKNIAPINQEIGKRTKPLNFQIILTKTFLQINQWTLLSSSPNWMTYLLNIVARHVSTTNPLGPCNIKMCVKWGTFVFNVVGCKAKIVAKTPLTYFVNKPNQMVKLQDDFINFEELDHPNKQWNDVDDVIKPYEKN